MAAPCWRGQNSLIWARPSLQRRAAADVQNGGSGARQDSSAEKGRQMFEAKTSRLAELLQAIYRSPKREIHLAPKDA